MSNDSLKMSQHDLDRIRDFTISRWIHLLYSLNDIRPQLMSIEHDFEITTLSILAILFSKMFLLLVRQAFQNK